MSSVTLFPHLFQHRMIVIKYSSDLTKIFVILKSYFGYSYYLSLFMLIKRLVPMPNKHRDESLTRGSTLFAYTTICLFMFICSDECLSRSEERRVGQESRSRWWASH